MKQDSYHMDLDDEVEIENSPDCVENDRPGIGQDEDEYLTMSA
jgi:hypothetical protein